MKTPEKIIFILLSAVILAPICLAGCSEGKNQEENSTPESSVQESTAQESSAAKSEKNVESRSDEKQLTSEKSGKDESSQKIPDVSKTESSKQESDNDNMTDTEKKVSTIIKNYTNSDISEKDLFNQVYELDDYKAAGHVITDIDGDGAYELVTRSTDEKTIRIYELSDNKIMLAKDLTGETKADLIYVFDNKKWECYFETLDRSDNNTAVKVFNYNGPDKDMDIVLECNVLKMEEPQTIPTYVFSDNNGTEIIETDSKLKYITNSWCESFNDSFTEACEQTKDKKLVNPEPIGYGSGEQPILTYYENCRPDYEGLIKAYYGEGYVPLWHAENMCLGIHLKDYDSLIINEIIGRHNYKFTDPMTTAFMNKKSYYNADPDAELFNIDFNEYEKDNYENITKIIAGQA